MRGEIFESNEMIKVINSTLLPFMYTILSTGSVSYK